MQLTLRDLLNTDTFQGFYVISGHAGLDHAVSTATVMDAPDIYKWIRGGEILITTGYILQNNLDYFSFLIKKLKEANAAALFIKLGRFFEELPPEVIMLSEHLEFPIVYMPIDLAFTDVINPVLSKLVLTQSEVIRYSDSIHKSFIDIAVHGQGIAEVISACSMFIRENIIYYDSYFGKLYQKDTNFQLDEVNNDFLQKYPSFPVNINNRTYGYFIIIAENYIGDEYSNIVIEHAATIVKVEIQKEISNLQIERKYRDQFVQDILFQNIKYIDEIEKRGRIFGWNFNGQYRVIIMDIDDLKIKHIHTSPDNTRQLDMHASELLLSALSIVKLLLPQIIYATFSDHIVIITKEPENKTDTISTFKKIALEVQQKASSMNYGFTLSFAFGNTCENITLVHQSYQEAKIALQLASLYGDKERIVFYKELGIYTLLNSLQDNSYLANYTDKILAPILMQPKHKCIELLETLKNLIDCNWNIKDTSDIMYLHYNTLKQRYHKLEQILDMDFDKVINRVNIEIALRHYQLRQ